jgi:nitrogen fixation NifU-like protein
MNKELIIQRYKHPKYFSKNIIPNGKSINSHCGDEIYVKITVSNNLVTEAMYNGSGCSICLATADILIENILNKEIIDIKKITQPQLFELIGMDEDSGRKRCATLSLEAITDALNNVE